MVNTKNYKGMIRPTGGNQKKPWTYSEKRGPARRGTCQNRTANPLILERDKREKRKTVHYNSRAGHLISES